MKTIRSIPAATSGWVRSNSAMLVCGPVATRVTSSPLPIAADSSWCSRSTAASGDVRRSEGRENPPSPSLP